MYIFKHKNTHLSGDGGPDRARQAKPSLALSPIQGRENLHEIGRVKRNGEFFPSSCAKIAIHK